jgi:hypothetical protein
MYSSQGPDFVCIGAQKAGTTWLHYNLNDHPDVWLPPIKEFHYFNRVRANEALLGDWDIPHPGGFYKRYLTNKFPPNLNDLRWMRQYYQYRISKKAYLGLFADSFTKGKVCGDITPGYSTLDDSGVRYANKVLGSDTPIIFILRDPIDRSWSAAKMMSRYYKKDYDANDYADILALLKKPHITLCGDYANIISRWRDYFENVHVMTYDKLCTSPAGFLEDVSKVLDIRNQWDDEKINQRVWSDKKNSPIPPIVHKLLKEQYYSSMEELYELTGLIEVKQWMSAADSFGA